MTYAIMAQVFEPGARSRRTSIFMLPEDEPAFDRALAPAIAGLGQWENHNHRAKTITPHDSLPDAIGHNGVQAFLRLRGRDGGTAGPLIQYLRTVVRTTDEVMRTAAGGRYRAMEDPQEMSPGRLAFK